MSDGLDSDQFDRHERPESDFWQTLVLENTLDAVIGINEFSTIIDWNQQAEIIFGWSKKEALGKKLTETIIPSQYREAHTKGMRRFLETGEGPILKTRIEIEAVHKGGHVFPVELTIIPVKVRGKYLFYSFLRDISERRRSEEVLKETERRVAVQYEIMSILAESTALANAAEQILKTIASKLGWDFGSLWMLDSNQKTIHSTALWSSPSVSWSEYTKRTQECHFQLGEGFPGRIWKSRKSDWSTDVARDMRLPRSPAAEQEGVHGGFWFPVQVSNRFYGVLEFLSREVRPPDLGLLRTMEILGEQIAQFIERVSLEETLKIRSLVLESINEGVCLTDENGTIVYTNPAENRMFGYESGELIGKNVSVLNAYPPDENVEKVRNAINSLKQSGLVSGEWCNKRKDGSEFFSHAQITTLDIGGIQHFVCVQEDITEMRLAREALIASELRYRSLFEQSPLSTQTFSPNGRTIRVNKAWVDLWGLSEEFINNYLLVEYNVLEDAQLERKGILNYLKRGFTGEILTIPAILYDPLELGKREGRSRWVEAFIFPVKDEAGKVIELNLIHHDITERKLAEDSLKQSEARFRLLAEVIPQIVWSTDPNGTVVYYNQRWVEFTGVTMGKAQSTDWTSVIHPDDLLKCQTLWKNVLQSGEIFAVEYRLRRKDGYFKWFLGKAAPLRDDHGTILQWFGTATDIDDQKRALLAQSFLDEASMILGSTLDYQTTLQAVADLAVSRLSDWCCIDMVNEKGGLDSLIVAHKDPRKVELAYDFKKKFPVDMNVSFGPSKVVRTGKSELYSNISEELLVELEVSEEYSDFMRRLEIHSIVTVPLMTKAKPFGALTLVLSKSERRYSQDDLNVAQELARRAAFAIENSKLFSELKEKKESLSLAVKSRDEFLSIASHELRTPITPIKLQLQNLALLIASGKMERISVERLKRFIDQSDKQLGRLAALVDDLLDVSRISTGRLTLNRERLNLSEVVKDSCDRYSAQAYLSGCTISLELPDLLYGSFDRLRIEQVVINLLTNAIKYAPGKEIKVSVQKNEGVARVSVQDQGIGISEENLERIFDRFERIKSSVNIGGLGLGLYISRQIVQAHGGRIWVKSRLGQGSTFVFEIPLAEESGFHERTT